jgi:hypothetical protein
MLDLVEDRREKARKDINGYQPFIGSLLYAAHATWPNISFAVALRSRYNSQPFASHLTSTKQVLHYLKSAADFRMHFTNSSPGSNDELAAYMDSGWGNDSADRKTEEGHVFHRRIGAFSWQTLMHDLITKSTLRAKYIDCSVGSGEAQWQLELHHDMHSKDASLLPINCDNQDTLSHSTSRTRKACTKHIDVCDQNC